MDRVLPPGLGEGIIEQTKTRRIHAYIHTTCTTNPTYQHTTGWHHTKASSGHQSRQRWQRRHPTGTQHKQQVAARMEAAPSGTIAKPVRAGEALWHVYICMGFIVNTHTSGSIDFGRLWRELAAWPVGRWMDGWRDRPSFFFIHSHTRALCHPQTDRVSFIQPFIHSCITNSTRTPSPPRTTSRSRDSSRYVRTRFWGRFGQFGVGGAHTPTPTPRHPTPNRTHAHTYTYTGGGQWGRWW